MAITNIVAQVKANSARFPANQGQVFSYAEQVDLAIELAIANQKIKELEAQLLDVTSVASALNHINRLEYSYPEY